MSEQPGYPDGGGEQSLQVAIVHLEVLLEAIASFDGKSLFLSGVNSAVLGAQIGVVATGVSGATAAAAIVGLIIASLAALAGLWDLWAADTTQFPSPKSLREFRTGRKIEDNDLAWAYLTAIEISSSEAEDIIARKIQRLRRLIVLTVASIALATASTISSDFLSSVL